VRVVVTRGVAIGERSVALLGLSFKSNTDDQRERPNVELAELLLGKGFDLRVYDPIINPARLMGANKRHVESRLPHLGRLLYRSADDALEGVGVAVVAHADDATRDALLAARPRRIIDLHGQLGPQVEALAGYEGIGW
jgi:GDP-mannose 6-dehydrogenase